jgi:hypothetical protein
MEIITPPPLQLKALCEFCDAVKCDLQNYDQMIKTEVGS